MLKLGGLFSGVGGFELAWTRLGGEVAWMCEWDPKARQVLQARFPDVPIYPDVRDLDPAEVEAVDVVTGGSPCQGFSVAGTRSGLEHGESRLFADYIRIVDGLAARGLKFALWENVPGVLSIQNDDGEMTFEHVVAALVGAEQPVRLERDARWNTGLAARGSRAVAWRVLDSRYFGVAQRRRRVFACVAFGDSCEDRAGRTLLAVGQGLSRDFTSRSEEGRKAAGDVAERAGVPCVARTLKARHDGSWTADGLGNEIVWWNQNDFADTLTSTSDDQRMPDKNRFQAVLQRKVRSDEFVEDDTGSTLAARDYKDYGDLVMEPQAFSKSRRVSSVDDFETWVDDGQANTLNTFDTGDVRTTHAIVEPANADFVGTLAARMYKGLNSEDVRDGSAIVGNYGVRRLTPVECERLQSFPDGWTEPAGSDSARYKAMGNAVTVNVVQWILGRMIANIDEQ